MAAVNDDIVLQRLKQPLYPTNSEVARGSRVPTRQVDVDYGATGVNVHGDLADSAPPDLVGDPAEPGSGHHGTKRQRGGKCLVLARGQASA